MTVDAASIGEAATRIAPHVERTPLLESQPMSARHGASIAIKCEHLQVTGSFKVRGSANVVHGLSKSDAARGVATASSGNHGIGVATAAASRGIAATIFLPEKVSPSKVAQIRRLGATIETVPGSDSSVAEAAAREHAEANDLAYVSPYNDPAIIAGQGTIAKEILEDGPAPDAVVVSVGGGGLISGIGTWIKAHSPTTTVIGASAVNDRAMAASIAAGRILPDPPAQPTFSDGTAGGLEENTVTFDICRDVVDVWMDMSEAEIAVGVAAMIDDHHQLVEGAAGLALAAAAAHADANPGARIVVVSCGANVTAAALGDMLAVAQIERGH